MRSILLTPSVSSIKIPKHSRSFIKNIHEEEKDIAIIKAIIAFSKSLNLDLIREVVENAQQKKFLIKHGCNYIKGHYDSYALPKEKMREMLLKV